MNLKHNENNVDQQQKQDEQNNLLHVNAAPPAVAVAVAGNVSTLTDSGVIIIDNNQMYNNKLNNNINVKNNDYATTSGKNCDIINQTKNLIHTTTTNSNENYLNNDHDNKNSVQNSPCTSLRSLSISIVSIDANALDSSIVDSDFDTDTATEGVAQAKYVVYKLGEQTTYAAGAVDLPQLTEGLKVVSQVVNPQDEPCTPHAQSTDVAQMGTIAVNHSSDVTFGDKHYYEGPVTIQQFLIDSRDKRQEEQSVTTGQTNLAFLPEKAKARYSNDIATKIISSSIPTDLNNERYCFGIKLSQRRIMMISIIIALITMGSILVYVLVGANDMRTSKQVVEGDSTRLIYPNNTNIGGELYVLNGTLRLIPRDAWQARPARNVLKPLVLPVHRVIIAHTATETCQTDHSCIYNAQVIQNYHMDSMGWSDIGYNFLIGNAGQVFVGRDWDKQGSHTLGYNVDSIGIAFIGTYMNVLPTSQQVKALELLLEWGVQEKKLVQDYRLYGARQLASTASPGIQLYNIIKNFSHWSSKL